MINKGKVLSLRKIKSNNFFSQNRFILLMGAVFLLGTVISIVFYSKKGSVINFGTFVDSFYINRSSIKFFKILFSSFIYFFSVLVLMFVMGTSIMGMGIIPAVIFVLGYISGGISSYLYSAYSLKGLAFNSLIVLPPSIVFFCVCFFAAKTSFDFSLSLSKTVLKRTSSGKVTDFKIYSNKYLILSVFVLITSVFDAALSNLFIGIFKF